MGNYISWKQQSIQPKKCCLCDYLVDCEPNCEVYQKILSNRQYKKICIYISHYKDMNYHEYKVLNDPKCVKYNEIFETYNHLKFVDDIWKGIIFKDSGIKDIKLTKCQQADVYKITVNFTDETQETSC